jgi:hypothetical protein
VGGGHPAAGFDGEGKGERAPSGGPRHLPWAPRQRMWKGHPGRIPQPRTGDCLV